MEAKLRAESSVERMAVVTAVASLCLFVVALGLQHWLPPQASAHSSGIDTMLQYLMVTLGILLVIGHIVLGYLIFRFGRGGRATYRLASAKLERRWSIIPIIVMSIVAEGGVIALGLPVWTEYIASSPPADSVQVEVTGEQFAWNVRYPGDDGVFGRTDPYLITFDNPLGLDAEDAAAKDDIIQLGTVNVPVNKPIRVRLRSKDVLHSFFLPFHRVKQDAVPGMTIDLWFIPTDEGEFEIACTELCGLGHYNMRGVLNVMSEAAYRQWLGEQTPFAEYL